MIFGVTPDGFQIKRLTDIKEEQEASLRTYFGPSINLLPSSVLGVLVGIYSEREAKIWELAKGVYDAFYPNSATGVNLDNVVAITGIKRLEATFSEGVGYAFGVSGTVIKKGSIVSVAGDPSARYVVQTDATILVGTDEVQDIDFSLVPDSGLFTLVLSGEETTTIPFGATALDVQNALNGLVSLSTVTVTGDFTAGFTVTFTGADGEKAQSTLVIGQNTLKSSLVAVATNVVKTTLGVIPNVACNIKAEKAGLVQGFANSITIIETPIAGWLYFKNIADVTLGEEIENDPDLRRRRILTLANAGAGTEEAIRASLLEIDEVEGARVFSNRQIFTDAFGRPPKSFECVVEGGSEEDIKQIIWINAPAGIEIYGDIATTIIDTQGFTESIKYSRPTGIPIYIIITLVTDSSFPVDGDEAVKEAVATAGDQKFSIGDDVITTQLYCAIHTVQGILDITIDIGTAPAPVGDANIPIADDETSIFDTSTITVI